MILRIRPRKWDLCSGIVDRECSKSLSDLVARFGELALQLWSTKLNIVYYLREYGNILFAPVSEENQASRVVRLDEYDTALDGRPIQAVVQPVIAAFGAPDEKEYQKRKIWAKAVVWISNRDRPPPVMIMRRSSKRVPRKSSNPLDTRIQSFSLTLWNHQSLITIQCQSLRYYALYSRVAWGLASTCSVIPRRVTIGLDSAKTCGNI
jgi:hypothetical protein